MLKKRVKMGEDEKERLTLVLHQRQMGLSDENIREMENAYHQKGRDYPSQMPFPYHVQPIQPNLHESK
ncbi:hypothetical protein IFM89_018215 [Coptis chinensis]|uniref:Uncharacterized protein n=1 Tax=Coptis chinensis TaxID=261450 RepID=A0A835I437_9MAGN|nr:hypothetical protein IFM89_018215 [Coptis chinensis]